MSLKEKIIEIKLHKLLFNYKKFNEFNFIFDDLNEQIVIGFGINKIAGNEYLQIYLNYTSKVIENKWLKYKADLDIEDTLMPATIMIDISQYKNQYSVFFDENNFNIKNISEIKLEFIIENIIQNLFLPELENIRKLKYCNDIINKDILINDYLLGYSYWEGLPFRKVLIAQEVNDPRLPEIITAMRKYCDEQYELGKKEDFEKLCKLKPVFEKLFGE
jgi:hypothetical protein